MAQRRAKSREPRSTKRRRGRAAADARGAEPQLPPGQVALLASVNGTLVEQRLQFGTPEHARQAMGWKRRVLRRGRWKNATGIEEQLERDARDLFITHCGLKEEDLAVLASADTIEVSIPFREEATDWQSRILPWEYLLSTATREWRKDRPLLVVRHLDSGAKGVEAPHPSPLIALLVTSTPGKLDEEYSLDLEEVLLRNGLGVEPRLLPSADQRTGGARAPTEDQLRSAVATQHPHVVHLAGVDSHEGASLLGLRSPEEDGYFIADATGQPVALEAKRLADVLTDSGRHPPRLVASNVYNSGARIAPLAVACGSAAAIGFQDTFDNDLAETFFVELYDAWHGGGFGSLLDPFRIALTRAREQRVSLRGSGVVLWSACSLLRTHDGVAADEPRAARRAASRVDVELDEGTDPSALLHTEVKPHANLNYAMLQNGRSPFERFTLTKLVEGRLRNVNVRVSLRVGSNDYAFARSLVLEDTAPRHLQDEISIPLTWVGDRPLPEAVITAFRVQIFIGNETRMVRDETHRVTLLPINEWRFAREDHQWLPSFVLPRDPAVAQVIDRAQKYLLPLFDDADAGFAGYQMVDDGADDPTEAIDLQVQAIWTSLVQDSPLKYINPPPSFVQESQRLRTPSAVLTAGRGTCLDLALLFAACLEYIDVYPVIFLLQDHAFPGYWRRDTDFEAHRSAADSSVAGSEWLASGEPGLEKSDWVYDENEFETVMKLVNDGKIVPLETVYLTERKGFWQAVAAGFENLARKADFYSLIDMPLAREKVTPLPVWGELG